MEKQISSMMKETFLFDLFIGIAAGVVINIFVKGYIIFALIGIGMAFINFAINSIITHVTFNKLTGVSALLFVLSYFLRIFMASLIGFIIFTHNNYGTLVYILGYMLHFVSIAIYTYKNRNS